ncbi:ribonuclease Z [Candidatus Woesearchaeota archaeon]|nr:ribonuclease Z [Candidatus Woesearchaeota archaeon]
MEITFLGTACMQPTKERNHPSVLLSYKAEGILFDCGEGTQRQLKICGFKPTKITKIMISHWHGDHVFGIPGLLQTIASSDADRIIDIYGPKGSKRYMENMFKGFSARDGNNFRVHEITKKRFYDSEDYCLEAMGLEHGIPCIGFNFVEKDRRKIKVDFVKKLKIPQGPLLGELQKGKSIKWKGRTVKTDDATYIVKGRKITYIADSLPCKNVVNLANDADLLISESSYTTEHQEKAEEYKHMTAREVGLMANKANVKQLVLTHFSQRYRDISEMEEDVKTVFQNVRLAYDCMKVKL